MGTAVVLTVLAVILFFVIRKLVKDRRAGKCSCGHECCSCPMAGQCHQHRK